VAEGGALLRRYTGLNRYRGFESLSLRQTLPVLFGFFSEGWNAGTQLRGELGQLLDAARLGALAPAWRYSRCVDRFGFLDDGHFGGEKPS